MLSCYIKVGHHESIESWTTPSLQQLNQTNRIGNRLKKVEVNGLA